MTRQLDTKSIFTEVQANHRRLDACALHHFVETEVRLGQKLTCQRCGGEMRLSDIGNYIRGYQAAGKPAGDVWPAWSGKAAHGEKAQEP